MRMFCFYNCFSLISSSIQLTTILFLFQSIDIELYTESAAKDEGQGQGQGQSSPDDWDEQGERKTRSFTLRQCNSLNSINLAASNGRQTEDKNSKVCCIL